MSYKTIDIISTALLLVTSSSLIAAAPALIPLPQKIEPRSGSFQLSPQTSIQVDASAREPGELLAAQLRRTTGYKLDLTEVARGTVARATILLTTKTGNADLGTEGYELEVSPAAVVIRAPQAVGVLYGVQSLLQLLPPELCGTQAVHQSVWSLPCLRITDRPGFKWRGFLLDSARHFFTKDEIKRTFDLMAAYKLNLFHWHLTDDQGWRLEIKRYPRLTGIGAWRKDIGFKLDPKSSTAYGPDGRYGGFYTQADIRELVAYARVRGITILPEIEMPGHASAALAAFPEYSCSGGPYTTEAEGGIFAGVYCAGKDETFEFLQNVLAEVIDLFPGKYVHIGGDEVPKENWKKCSKCQARMRQETLKTEQELQSYFVRRIEKYINSRGRNLIGWSEIREGGLAQNAVVMDWIGGAVEAASAGHDVVMTPTSFCYLDYYQSTNHATEPRAIGGYLPLSKVYSLEPIPANLPAQYQAHILGAQGNLWTEYVPNFRHAQYMMFPRLCALAEAVWSSRSERGYDDFLSRLQAHFSRLDQEGVNYRKGTPGHIGE
jgi:hexosaminidase